MIKTIEECFQECDAYANFKAQEKAPKAKKEKAMQERIAKLNDKVLLNLI